MIEIRDLTLRYPGVTVLEVPGLTVADWMRSLLHRLADDGTCVLVTTHLLDEVERNADRIVVLGNGRILTDCPLAELMDTLEPGETTLEDAYLRIAGPLTPSRIDTAL
ncbi:hypothetical protein [Nocardia sp. X0981]